MYTGDISHYHLGEQIFKRGREKERCNRKRNKRNVKGAFEVFYQVKFMQK
jgi:hypothetical protein